jgi:hypothetical protein
MKINSIAWLAGFSSVVFSASLDTVANAATHSQNYIEPFTLLYGTGIRNSAVPTYIPAPVSPQTTEPTATNTPPIPGGPIYYPLSQGSQVYAPAQPTGFTFPSGYGTAIVPSGIPYSHDPSLPLSTGVPTTGGIVTLHGLEKTQDIAYQPFQHIDIGMLYCYIKWPLLIILTQSSIGQLKMSTFQ